MHSIVTLVPYMWGGAALGPGKMTVGPHLLAGRATVFVRYVVFALVVFCFNRVVAISILGHSCLKQLAQPETS